MLNGQLCYKLEVNLTSGQGKEQQLMLVVDNNEDRSLQITPPRYVGNEPPPVDLSRGLVNLGRKGPMGTAAKTRIGTLSPNNHFGGGICLMTVVKRMSAKEDFLKMPSNERRCEVELYEDCRTRRLLKECNCVPREMPGYQVGILQRFDADPLFNKGHEEMQP